MLQAFSHTFLLFRNRGTVKEMTESGSDFKAIAGASQEGFLPAMASRVSSKSRADR